MPNAFTFPMTPPDLSAFLEPNWNAPLDVDAHIAKIPADASIKGMFFQDAIETAKRLSGTSPAARNYISFKSYPMREFVRVLADSARAAYPALSTRQGIRRLGSTVYPTLVDSMVGKVLFSIAEKSIRRALELTPRAYEITVSPGNAKLTWVEEGRAVLHLEHLWNFPGTYHVGIFEGAISAFEATGSVKVKQHSEHEAELLVTWTRW